MDKFIKLDRLERDGKKITVQIKEVIWGTYKDYYGKLVKMGRGGSDTLMLSHDFSICSSATPQLCNNTLFIHGGDITSDNRICYYNFDSETTAKKVYDLLKSISIHDKIEIFNNQEKLNKIIGGLVNDVICVVDQK